MGGRWGPPCCNVSACLPTPQHVAPPAAESRHSRPLVIGQLPPPVPTTSSLLLFQPPLLRPGYRVRSNYNITSIVTKNQSSTASVADRPNTTQVTRLACAAGGLRHIANLHPVNPQCSLISRIWFGIGLPCSPSDIACGVSTRACSIVYEHVPAVHAVLACALSFIHCLCASDACLIFFHWPSTAQFRVFW